jgi:Txe/YoeB family toxin of Txe-Axe toxin-antitoxin module
MEIGEISDKLIKIIVKSEKVDPEKQKQIINFINNRVKNLDDKGLVKMCERKMSPKTANELVSNIKELSLNEKQKLSKLIEDKCKCTCKRIPNSQEWDCSCNCESKFT